MTAPDLGSGSLGSEGFDSFRAYHLQSTPRTEAVRVDYSHGVRMKC